MGRVGREYGESGEGIWGKRGGDMGRVGRGYGESGEGGGGNGERKGAQNREQAQAMLIEELKFT